MVNKQEAQLTAREKQVVILICKNLKYREIAEQLGLGYETVKTYANRIRTKLGLDSKVAVVLWAQQKGLI
jgi:DNA-binding CsgD family transcriptional regulator